MNKSATILVGVAVVILVGAFVYFKKQSEITPAPVPVAQTEGSDMASGTSEQSGLPTPSGITMGDVSAHNDRQTCWAAINGFVYDLTSWIPNHPGGEQAILQLCGTDGSAKFNRQHGGNGTVLSVLAGFKIGTLAQ